jgi:hypothetical protein
MNIALEHRHHTAVISPAKEAPPVQNVHASTEFAHFMREQLSWRKIRVNKQHHNHNTENALAAIAERQNSQGKTFKDIAILWYALSAGLIIIGYALEYDSFFSDGMEQALSWSGSGLLVAISVFIFISQRMHTEKAWINCHTSTAKTGIEDVKKSIRLYWDYAANSGKPYKFVAHYFVSANGFTWDALQYAIENNIICYEKKNDSFAVVKHPVPVW